MITISDAAAEKIKAILKVEGLPNHGLRVVAGSGGGCCGSQYEIMLDEKPGDGDTVVEKNGSKLFLDKATAKALDGAELGFISEERGEGFALSYPNGAPGGGGSCGCGTDKESGSGDGCGSGGCGCG